MAAETTALAIVSIAEIVKLLLMAQSSAIKAGMTAEEYKALAEAVNTGFAARDPNNLAVK